MTLFVVVRYETLQNLEGGGREGNTIFCFLAPPTHTLKRGMGSKKSEMKWGVFPTQKPFFKIFSFDDVVEKAIFHWGKKVWNENFQPAKPILWGGFVWFVF